MKLKFTKMHALGNDFIVIDDRSATLKRIASLSRRLCDRRFGIGADQMLLLCHSRAADFRMRIFNADGSEVEMCGNGIRCLGKFIWDRVLKYRAKETGKQKKLHIASLAIETPGGIILLYRARNLIRVDMGEPVFRPDLIPAVSARLPRNIRDDRIVNYPLKVKGKTFKVTCVSLGNPHAVTVVKDVDAVPLDRYGPLIEHHSLFPNRINAEFIHVQDRANIRMRVWERGVGETMACGTGASASGIVSALLGLTDRTVNVHLPGGTLLIHWSPRNNHVYMTGPAEKVYEGVVEI